MAVLHLRANRHSVRCVEDTSDTFVHHQRRHQVFKHRPGPRQQSPLRSDGSHGPPQPQPMGSRHIALGDGKEAGETRLRR